MNHNPIQKDPSISPAKVSSSTKLPERLAALVSKVAGVFSTFLPRIAASNALRELFLKSER